MSWITLTPDDLLLSGKLTGAELTAVKTKALAPGQTNPIPEELANLVQEIRGRVAACSSNTLGAGDTIPAELKPTALAILRYRVLSRLPVQGLITPAREREYNDAMALLRDVALCKFRVEQPAVATEQKIAGPSKPMISASERGRWSAANQDGV